MPLRSYKKMKKELGDIEAEVFVLAHTEELLAAQEGSLLEKVRKVERQQGISVSPTGPRPAQRNYCIPMPSY